MCEFSHEGSVKKNILYKDAIIGSRFWNYNFKENTLKSLNREFLFNTNKVKTKTEDIPDLNGSFGIYSYGSGYDYNCSYYYNCYYYSNYNNYYNYYNYYNHYNYYYIAGIIKSYGPTIIHKEGQRSQKIEIIGLLELKRHDNLQFLEHFNGNVRSLASKLKVPVISFQFGENPITEWGKR